MFNFLDFETLDYQSHSKFVDVLTNKPRKINEIKKENFPYNYVNKLDICNIKTQENFLNKDECEYLVWLAETVLVWPELDSEFWNQRKLSLLSDIPKHHFAGAQTVQLVVDIHQKLKTLFSTYFNTECYADQIGLIRWPPGSYQMPHVDEVNGLDRVVGSIIYLNDDYKGGETYYPYYNKTITPKVGQLLMHSSDHSHLHGVTEVKEKTRYTISSTWTISKHQSFYEKELNSLKNYLQNVVNK